MPVSAARVAGGEFATTFGGAVAGEAVDIVAFRVFGALEIGDIYKASATGSSSRSGGDGLDEVAISICAGAVEMIAYVLGKLEKGGEFALEVVEGGCEQAARLLLALRRSRKILTHGTIPWLIQLLGVFSEGRVDTFEVKGTVASVTAEQIAAAATCGAKVVVLSVLWVEC